MPTTTFTDSRIDLRAIGERTDSSGTAVVADLSAEEERFSNILFTRGWVSPSDSFVPAKGTGWNVEIGSGATDVDLYVVQGYSIGQGTYLVRLDQSGDTIAVDPSDVSNPRTDEIYLFVQDNAYDSSGLGLARFGYRKGDVGPTAPTPGPDPAWTAYELLATVYVPASSTTLAPATLTDERVQSQSVADAPTLEGNQAADLAASDHTHASDYASQAHENDTSGHPAANPSASGFVSSSDKAKLNSIESLAEVNLSASELLALLVTVDGSGSGLDADLLDGSSSSSIATATHNHSYYTEAEVTALLSPLAWKGEQIDIGRAGAQAATSGVVLSPLMDVVRRDDWNGHTPSNNYISDDAAGFYMVDIRAEWAGHAGGSIRQIELTQSGTQIAVARSKPLSASYVTLCEASAIVYMNGGQAIYFYAYQDSGIAINLNSCNFKLTKLGT